MPRIDLTQITVIGYL